MEHQNNISADDWELKNKNQKTMCILKSQADKWAISLQ